MNHSIPSTMKCILYGKETLEKTVPVPRSNRKDHVLVKVMAAGLNPVDAKDVLGDKLPENYKSTKRFVRRHVISNCIPGFDFSGIIMEETDNYKLHDKVFGTMPPRHGTLAEFISVPLNQLNHMPQSYNFLQAAALPLVGLTALQALQPHIINNQSSVLVLGGSGGTGHVSLQVAKCLGAKHITTLCSGKNADFCKSFGAMEIIDYTRNEIVDDLQKAAGQPFDVVMDCVTSADPRDQVIYYPELLQRNHPELLSEHYIYRRLGGNTPDWFRAGLERTLGLSLWKDKHEKLFWVRFPNTVEELKHLAAWADDHTRQLVPHISKQYDFSAVGVQTAFDDILSRHVQGKVVVPIGISKE